MEFGEKLQELRKSRGLTQEELAELVHVSRTAVSKWESGRGYPSIDSLKELSGCFSVSIDELLSGEKLLSLAEKEHRAGIRSVCDLLFGTVDLCAWMLAVFPLYAKTAGEAVYGVNLFAHTESTLLNRLIHWALLLALMLLGGLNLVLTHCKRPQRAVTCLSMAVGVAAVLYLALAREAYAVTAAFLLLGMKTVLLFRRVKAGG